MTTSFVATAYVQAGKLHVRNRKLFDDIVGTWPNGEYLVTIEKAHATRSQQANRYYWGVIVHLISEHTGYTPEETHDVLKVLFLPKQVAMCHGDGDMTDALVIGGSTSRLNRVEFGDYITKIREWAQTTLGISIPVPMEHEEVSA